MGGDRVAEIFGRIIGGEQKGILECVRAEEEHHRELCQFLLEETTGSFVEEKEVQDGGEAERELKVAKQ